MYQGSLWASAAPGFDENLTGRVRRELAGGAWIDEVPNWLTGSDALFDEVSATAPWSAHDRVMWGAMVAEPRLSTRGWADPPELVVAMSRALGVHYGSALSAISANLYRDGTDSVAWHGDIAGRYRPTTVVAIVSLGSPRRFLVRPKGGGASRRFTPSHGDLLVMGGTCQHTFEHAAPKMASAGPRISVMFREHGVF